LQYSALHEWAAWQSSVNQLNKISEVPEFLLCLKQSQSFCELLYQKINKRYLHSYNWFQNLPEDLISGIFDFLDLQPLLRAEQVCKLWRTHLRTYGSDIPAWSRVFIQKEWSWSSAEHPFLKELGISSTWRSRVRIRQKLEENWVNDSYKQSILNHGESVYNLQLAGNFLVSAGKEPTVKYWEISTSKLLQEFHGHDEAIYALGISNSYIASGGADETVKIWKKDTPVCRLTLGGHESSVNALALAKNTECLVSGTQNGLVKEWSLETGRCVQTVFAHETDVYSLALTGNTIVTASRDTTLKGWDLRSGQCINTLLGHEHAVYCICWDGKRLLSGSEDMTVKIWDGGRCFRTIWGHSNSVRSVSVVGRRIITGSWDYTINMWSETGKCLREQLMKNQFYTHIGIAQCDNYRLASAVTGGFILIGNYIP